mmetsp:Transcript_3683/g.7224  ORF Transcript_3683/g.7224 Transcript_3683/m.7224 type:complete len:232 (+) Transcript_3683:45-740(+)
MIDPKKYYYTLLNTALLLSGSAKGVHSFLQSLPSSRPLSSLSFLAFPLKHSSSYRKDAASLDDEFISTTAAVGVLYNKYDAGYDDDAENLVTQRERRKFLQKASFAFFAIITSSFPAASLADEPSNLFYRSQADDEDPLVTFGKSLQSASSSFQNSSPGSYSSSGGDGGGGSEKLSQSANSNGGGAARSVFDITLPSSSSSPPPSASTPLSLDEAIKVESQKRRIDPRTHG